jgi:hypothetical protein
MQSSTAWSAAQSFKSMPSASLARVHLKEQGAGSGLEIIKDSQPFHMSSVYHSLLCLLACRFLTTTLVVEGSAVELVTSLRLCGKAPLA